MPVKIAGIITTPKYTFTSEDAKNGKLGNLLVNLFFNFAGLLSKLAWALTPISTKISLDGYFVEDDWYDTVSVIEGWSIDSTLQQIDDTTVEQTIREYDRDGILEKTITRRRKIFLPI